MTNLSQNWRWFGPDDPTHLSAIKQTGANGVVTALYHIPCGDIWPLEAIGSLKQEIEAAGLDWKVVESVNVHESIKTAAGQRDDYIANYQQTLRNLATHGIDTVCYNFMPVLDWTRTDLNYQVADASLALRYNALALAGFDMFILRRPGAVND